MVATPHVVTGLLIATLLERLRLKNEYFWTRIRVFVLACLASFFSHFLLDAIPHYDYSLYGSNVYDSVSSVSKVAADFLVAFAIFVFVFGRFMKATIKSWDNPGDHDEPVHREKYYYFGFLGFAGFVTFCGLLPDVIIVLLGPHPTVLYWELKKLHDLCHSRFRPDIYWGGLTQAAFCAGATIWLKRIAPKLKGEILGCKLAEEAKFWLSIQK